jgi:hypothetical protein
MCRERSGLLIFLQPKVFLLIYFLNVRYNFKKGFADFEVWNKIVIMLLSSYMEGIVGTENTILDYLS